MNTPKIRFKGFTDDWEQRKLGDICEQLSQTIDPKRTPNARFEEYSMPAFDQNMKATVVEGSAMNSTRKIISKECLLINKLNVRKKRIWLVEKPSDNAVCSAEFIPICSDEINLRYLKYFTLNDSFTKYLEDCSSGSSNSQKRVTPDIIMNAEIIVPVYAEQKKIGDYFRNLDHLITLHQRKCDETKELKKFMLQKMFPKNGEKNPEIRFEGFTDDWEQRKFEDVGTVAMCKRIFKEQTSEEGEVPFYKIGTFGGIPDAYITRELFEEYKKNYQYPNKGDILISASGSIGRTVEYTGKDEYYQDSNIVWLKHENDLDNSFLKVLYGVIEWSCEGSTIKRLYNDNFLKTEFMLPKIEEQIKIGEYFSKLDHLITLHQRKCEKLKELKKFMLQNMFV